MDSMIRVGVSRKFPTCLEGRNKPRGLGGMSRYESFKPETC